VVGPPDRDYTYDVCLSFASEQRPYVEKVAEALRASGLRVFYDAYEEDNLWGRDLYEHFDEVYRRAARFCVLFASREYVQKTWTTHERRSAQARALKEADPYILPVKFDDVEVPGIPPTIRHLDLRTMAPEELARRIAQRVGVPPSSTDGSPGASENRAMKTAGDLSDDQAPESRKMTRSQLWRRTVGLVVVAVLVTIGFMVAPWSGADRDGSGGSGARSGPSEGPTATDGPPAVSAVQSRVESMVPEIGGGRQNGAWTWTSRYEGSLTMYEPCGSFFQLTGSDASKTRSYKSIYNEELSFTVAHFNSGDAQRFIDTVAHTASGCRSWEFERLSERSRVRVQVKDRATTVTGTDQKVRFGLIAASGAPLMPAEYLFARRGDYVVIAAYGRPTANELIAQDALRAHEHLVSGVLTGVS
jgi:hypothetical protein